MAKKKKVNNKKEEMEAVETAKTAATKKYRGIEKPTVKKEIFFGKENYTLIGVGLAIVIVGFFLMAGGNQPSPDEWNAEEIYSFNRITLAPMVVLLGLGVVIFSIFKTPSGETAAE